MNVVLALPLMIPFLTAVAALLTSRRLRVQRLLGVGGAAGLLGVAVWVLVTTWRNGVQVSQMGDWPAPFGITLVADLFSAIMLVLTGIIGLAVALYSLASFTPKSELYYPLLHLMLMGICGAFLTGDLFNLYVWFEVLLIASFVLLVLEGKRAQIEGAVKYVALNLVSSMLFLTAIGLLYGLTGTLNMADLARTLRETASPGLVTTIAMVFLVAFGIKAAIFPLFFWLPASYHTPPPAVSAIFAGLLTKVGVYALIRVFTLVFVQDVAYTHTLLLILAGLTMLTGVLGAVVQTDFRRILSFNLISHIGYMVMGLGLFTPFAVAGSVFYIVHHIIVKTNLFLISGIAYQLGGTYNIKNLGGLYHHYPFVAFLFLLSALSLAGLPPLSGFFAKLALVQAGLELGQYAIVSIALGVGFLTLFSMTMIWDEAFWKPHPHALPSAALTEASRLWLFLPVIGLTAATVFIGLAAESVFILSLHTAEQLLNPAIYIHAVLGEVQDVHR